MRKLLNKSLLRSVLRINQGSAGDGGNQFLTRQLILLSAWVIVGFMLASDIAYSGASCGDCHSDQVAAWQASDHAWSMRLPKRSAVKAPFTGEMASFDGLEAQFDQEPRDPGVLNETGGFLGNPDGVGETRFIVKLRDTKVQENEFQSYVVRYTFGHDPLQQFLIPLGSDRLQVAPFTFDSRPESEGGQRWIHLEAFESDERWSRIDWRQPLQNWNGMCADCHSRGFKRGYDPETQRFESSFEALNVDCKSCHALPEDHGKKMTAANREVVAVGEWIRPEGASVAHWRGAPRDPSAMERCFACHSLRSPLTDGFGPESVFLDHFRPEPVLPPHYQPDGQIEGEVYVYGSFLQSKMYASGVQCIDCHDPHTAALKDSGNALCADCHSPEVFNNIDHHRHDPASKAGQCVMCHMPGKTYMGVDFRRDHRFSVPNPPLAKQLGARDVCQDCHDDRWQQFNAQEEAKVDEGEGGMDLRRFQQPPGWMQLSPDADAVLAMLKNPSLPAIIKAARLASLPVSLQSSSQVFLPEALAHPDGLIRLRALEWARAAGVALDPVQLAALQTDRLRAVRLAALAMHAGEAALSGTANDQLMDINPSLLSEYDAFLVQNAWRGEGRLVRADQAQRLGDWRAVEQELRMAIDLDPHFEGGYVNLADLYRRLDRDNEGREVLEQGISKVPTSGMLHYSLGLLMIRAKAYERASLMLREATALAPAQVDVFYTLLLVEDALGRRGQAKSMAVERYPSAMPQAIKDLLLQWRYDR